MYTHHRSRPARAAATTIGCALTVVLAACSSSSTPAASSGASSSGSSTAAPAAGASGGGAAGSKPASGKAVHLGMELLFSGVPFTAETQAGAQAAAQELGVKLDVSGPPSLDPPTAISQVNNFLDSGVDGIAIGDEPAALWTRALNDAVTKTKGNVVAYNSVPAKGTTVKTYVGIDAADYGRQLATETIKAAGLGADTTGEVIIGQCVPQSDPLTLTVGGITEATKQLLPKATVLTAFNSQVVPSQNFAAWEQEMRAHPNAVLALGPCDQDADSMIKAKQDTKGKFAIGGVATSPQVLTGLADGTVAAILAQNWYVMGYTAARLMAEAASKGTAPVEGWINPGTTVITKANAAAIKARDASPAGQAAFYKPLVTKLWANLGAATKPLSAAQH